MLNPNNVGFSKIVINMVPKFFDHERNTSIVNSVNRRSYGHSEVKSHMLIVR